MRRIPMAIRLLGSFCLSWAVSAHAIQPPAADPPGLSDLKAPALRPVGPNLDVTPSLVQGGGDTAIELRAAAFRRQHLGEWELRWDTRGDRPNVVQGSGAPLVPGSGNTLEPARFGVASAAGLDLATVQREARRFVDEQAALLKLDGLDLRPDPERSVGYGNGNPFWSIEFGQYSGGVRVDGAFVYVRVSHGNVIQFGAERVGEVAIDAQPSLTREQAFYLAWRELDFPADTRMSEVIEPGELRLYPVAPAGEAAGVAFGGVRGAGYAHVLAWRYVFRVAGNPATWEVLFDAHANRVVDVRDLNDYIDASVTGGIYPTTNSDTEIVVPFPFVAVTNNGAKVTDTLGIYDYSGGSASTSLNGQYFRMSDACGSISLTNASGGDLAFGAGSGTDCATPPGNTAGAGNTHASRSGFYHLTRINEKARGILTSNSWLRTKVTANMNINQVCNAYWDGGALNFFKSGSGCSNTGEIAAVFLHEWGHGLDQNTGGAASEMGSGEAVGDTFAFLETRDSCIGANFTPGRVCHNCTTCTGVRDVRDFGRDGSRPIARPSNVEVAGGIRCTDYVGLGGVSCPYTANNGQIYRGPMGYEGHCESLIASSANWDLKSALVERFGDDGWDRMDDIWYGSLTPSKSAYRLASGGTCNPNAQVDGCAATNWYTVFLAADDDDGNLSNGTPNGCRIFDAFEAHGIACGQRPACTADTDTADFTLALTNDPQSVCASASASWGVAVGAVAGFANPVTLSADGLPAGTSASFSPNPVAPGTASTMTVATTAGTAAGSYTITVSGSANGSAGHAASAHLTVGVAPAAPQPATPADGSTDVALPPTLAWQASASASAYAVEVATDAAFTTIVASQSGIAATSWTVGGLASSTHYYWRVRATGSCGSSASSAVYSFTTRAALYTIGGDVAGLAGGGLALSLNGGAAQAVSANGHFTFDTSLVDGSDYAVTVAAQPAHPNQTCTVANGQGRVAGANVTNVQVTCTTSTYAIGGRVGGLAGGGFALSLNGGTPQPIAANGDFTFATRVADGSDYAVTIAAQPTHPNQACRVGGARGRLDGSDVTSVVVGCTTSTYAVHGTVTGLLGQGLALSLNGGAALPIDADGDFAFPLPLDDGSAYEVAIASMPDDPRQACTVSNGSGRLDGGDAGDVAVTCSDRIFGDGFEAKP